MLTGQEDEQPRLSFGQYLSKGSVLPTLKVGRADLDAGIFMKAILQGMVWVDRLAIGNHDNNQPRIARDGNWRRERGKYKNEL